MLLDPSQCDDFGFDKLRAQIASRVGLVPRFGWKLQEVPFELDRPYWVAAEGFIPSDHVIRTAVPSPGTIAQVYELAARLHAQPLDRDRPLWQVYCIEGVEGGRVAIYMKTHHCLVDGTGGAGLAEVMADLTADATGPIFAPDAFQETTPTAPSAGEVVSRALRNGVERPAKLASHLRRGLAQLWEARDDDEAVGDVERVCFNKTVSKRRAFASTSFQFERVRDLTKHFDVKVNDVVLEIAGSAVRRWLRDRGEAPTRPLVAMCPVSTRGDEQGLGNQITSMAVSLCTDLVDPAERLRAIHRSSQRAKQRLATANFDWTGVMGEGFVPAVAKLLVKAAEYAGDTGPLPGNFVVSNVRSAPVPLYIAGARVESMIPLSMLAVGNGLNVTLVSYCDRIDVGLVVDPELIPDAWELAGYFPTALEELETAAEGVVHRAR